MWAKCGGPIWNTDDLSQCFQSNYLRTGIPLAACASSVLLLVGTHARYVARQKKIEKDNNSNGYTRVRTNNLEERDNEDGEDITGLTLQKTVSHANESMLAYDKPSGEVLLVAIELLVSLSQVAISVAALILRGHSKKDLLLATLVSPVIIWTYLTGLVAVRLYRSIIAVPFSTVRLWNHSATLYWIQWLLQVFIFRSEIIHSVTKFSRNIEISRFIMTTLLAIIVLISRRGNRQVLLEYDGDIEPSREPLASTLSILSFGWADPLIWRGYKKTLELEDVWNVTVKDKAEVVLANFRQVAKTHKLAVQLLLHFKKPILIQGVWCVIGSIFSFLPTLLLKAILEYVETPDEIPANAAWLYVILLLATVVIQATSDGQGLWIGRRICIQLRGLIIGEIYSKVLRRKAAALAESKIATPLSPPTTSFWKRVKSLGRKQTPVVPSTTQSVSSQANNGTVINLMSVDSFKVSEICSYLHFLWASVPVQLIMAVALLYKVLGFSGFAGVGLMVLVLPLNLYIAKSFTRAQKRIMAATDGRIHATNEVLQNIRIIKYFAWEQRFANKISEKRQVELDALWRKYVLWSSAATVWSGVPILITFASFLLFTLVEKRPLVPSIAFPALSMFSLLRVPLDQLADMVAHIQESKVSVDRIEEFLNEEETDKYNQLKSSKNASLEATRIALESATLSWGSEEDIDDASEDAPATFRLIDIDVEFQVGKLSVIAGPTGSGKTSLLMALLGEMKLLEGRVLIPGGCSREELSPDSTTGLTESVAYCAQQAWLVNDTIKENIVFASPYNLHRYNAVIKACALSRDLEILDAGDQTLVGEKGITLSGGQKQRISLARALYSTSKHVLLDDCLSAVDSHTAKHIFEQALTGSLMIGRTCVLVSHNVALTVRAASQIVLLENGRVVAKGSPDTVIDTGLLGEEMLKSRPTSKAPTPTLSRTASDLEPQVSHLSGGVQTNGPVGDLAKAPQTKGIDPRKEQKATGSVKLATMHAYLTSMGPWYYWIFASLGFVAVQLGSIVTNVWIREWSNAYSSKSSEGVSHLRHLQSPTIHMQPQFGRSFLQSPAVYPAVTNTSDIASVSGSANDVDAAYYLLVYACIGLGYVCLCFGRELLLFWGSLRASFALHDRLLHNILRATFRFYDSTPLGQLTNRFSKDVQAIDQEVAPVAIGFLHSAAAVLTIIVLITVITPGFLLPGFFIACSYAATGYFYIHSSRDLKRIESVQRSPLFQHFGETLSGVVTIRAYGDESRFLQDSHRRVNTHNRPFFYLWATNRWLAFRVDMSGALVSFFSATFVVLNAKKIDAGAAGLSLTYAITFTQNVVWLVRLYAANEQNMNAVERVQEYIEVEQEAPALIPETRPEHNWPSHGAVEFVNYSTRYRKDLDPVLRGLTFKIQAAQKVGIVGRTGAGKSSLALALFRGLEADEGKILIDNVDIGLIGLQDLREAITIVPQDPTLFSGTLRSNLDPFELFTDEEVFTALRRVQLIAGDYGTPKTSGSVSSRSGDRSPTLTNGSGARNGHLSTASDTVSSGNTLFKDMHHSKDNKNIFLNLSSPIAESGSNLSQGQRQLLCLARALLKSPKVLVMDEATASIDYATDSKIQDTLRELKHNTIITIAHRLQTIIDYDRVLVLDAGKVVEYADPWELIRQKDGVFRGMCETSGDMEILMALAKKSWEERRLIDDS